jgi:teichuronic acid exporter
VNNYLRTKTIRALFWSLFGNIWGYVVRFVTGIALARLLLPEQFGLIAMLAIFIAVAQSFIDGGFYSAFIQKREVTPADSCSIFYFNIVMGVVVAGLLCLIAPWVATFYKQPILSPLMRVLSLTLVIGSFGNIHYILLTKEINFKLQTKVGMLASVLSGIAGVAFAIAGFGVWSLAIQQVSSAFFQTVLIWFWNAWRPAWIFSFKSLRDMFAFGSRLLASALLIHIFGNIYSLVIGKFFSATDLGFYTRAKALEELPSRFFSWNVGLVTFPVFSSIQHELAQLKTGLKKVLAFLGLVNFPLMVGLAIIARPLVMVLLTEKWAECIPYLQLFCGVELLFPVILINQNLLQTLGRSDLFLRLEIINKGLLVVNIAITWQWGISAMICGLIVLSIISCFLTSYYSGGLIGYPIWEQLRDLLPYLFMAVLMGVPVFAAGLVQFSNYWVMLLVQIAIGIVTYFCLCRLFRLQAFMEAWQGGWNKISNLRSETIEG